MFKDDSNIGHEIFKENSNIGHENVVNLASNLLFNVIITG
jgi:hypothetical protein